MYKKIQLCLNGRYLASTNQHKRCRDAVAKLRTAGECVVASLPNDVRYAIRPTDKLTARFAK